MIGVEDWKGVRPDTDNGIGIDDGEEKGREGSGEKGARGGCEENGSEPLASLDGMEEANNVSSSFSLDR